MKYFEDCETLDEAKAAYYKLAQELHPDKGGETADFQELLNQFQSFRPGKQKFAGEFEQWDATRYAEIINQLFKIPGIQIIVCGSWIWLSGDTKPVKEQIKAIECGERMKRGFSPKKGQWYFSPKGYRKTSRRVLSFGEITSIYGAQEVKGDQEEEKIPHRLAS